MTTLPTIGDIRGLRSALNRLTYLVGRKAEAGHTHAEYAGVPVPFNGSAGAVAGRTGTFVAATTGAQTLAAGTWAWLAVAKLTLNPVGADADGYLVIRRDDTGNELHNGGARLYLPLAAGRLTAVTTGAGTITLAEDTEMSFSAAWSGATGTVDQDAAQVALLVFQTA